MNRSIVLEEINLWEKEFEESKKINPKLYEIAIFKIFVKLELFLTEMFIIYATGEASSSGYIAKRRLEFQDKKHLEGILKSNKAFIDYGDKIKSLSGHIFIEKSNPFDLIFLDCKYFEVFNKLKAIRNYVAHESSESKRKYIKDVLNNSDFVEPHKYLMKINKKHHKSEYTLYIKKITEMVDLIVNPKPYLNDDIEVTVNLRQKKVEALVFDKEN